MADVSIAKLARIAGISAVVVRNHEREHSRPSAQELDAISRALASLGIRCSVDDGGGEVVVRDPDPDLEQVLLPKAT